MATLWIGKVPTSSYALGQVLVIRYFCLGIFPGVTSQVTLSQDFPNVQFPKRKLQGYKRAQRCGWSRLGKSLLGKFHIWEVTTWEISHQGSGQLEKYNWKFATWKKVFGKVADISLQVTDKSKFSKKRTVKN